MVVYVVVCHIPVRLLRHFADAPQRRGGQISHFLLALAKTPYEIGGPKPTEFVTFTKVGTGYNMAELNELWGKLRDHWKPVCVADCAVLCGSALTASGSCRNPDSNNLPWFLGGWKAAKRDDKPGLSVGSCCLLALLMHRCSQMWSSMTQKTRQSCACTARNSCPQPSLLQSTRFGFRVWTKCELTRCDELRRMLVR